MPKVSKVRKSPYMQDSEFTGCCPVCMVQYNGRVHICHGPNTNHDNPLITKMHLLDYLPLIVEPIGQRIEDGFAMLQDSGLN